MSRNGAESSSEEREKKQRNTKKKIPSDSAGRTRHSEQEVRERRA